LVKLGIEAFKANVNRYTDVKMEQYMNELYRFTKDLLIKLEKAKVDIKRYSTNTKMLSSKTKNLATEYEVDVEAYTAKTYYNEVKADVNMSYNELALEEMENNLDLQLKEVRSNMNAFIQKAQIHQSFIASMGADYSQYVSSALESINILLNIAKSYVKQNTVTPT